MYAGKLLRLQQQYLWSSASLQDILRRFTKLELPWNQLPDYVCIQSEPYQMKMRKRTKL